jgi:hypothetical protein
MDDLSEELDMKYIAAVPDVPREERLTVVACS